MLSYVIVLKKNWCVFAYICPPTQYNFMFLLHSTPAHFPGIREKNLDQKNFHCQVSYVQYKGVWFSAKSAKKNSTGAGVTDTDIDTESFYFSLFHSILNHFK